MDHNRQPDLHRTIAPLRRKIDGATGRRRDGETERRSDGETERRTDGETAKKQLLSVPLSLRPSVPLSLCPSVSSFSASRAVRALSLKRRRGRLLMNSSLRRDRAGRTTAKAGRRWPSDQSWAKKTRRAFG